MPAWPTTPWADLFSMVLQDLERNPWKTALTILGLVIGSAAVVAVTSVGLAARSYAIQQLETLGTNFIWVSYHGPSDASTGRGPGGRRRELNEQDFEEIERSATALAAVSRVVVLYSTLAQGGKNYPISLVGADGSFARVRNLAIDQGRALTAHDVRERRKVSVLSRSLADKLYGRSSALRRTLKIEDFNFDVVGVFRDVKTPGVETELSRDAVLIPISVARFSADETSIDTLYAQARSRETLPAAMQQIRQVLTRHHGRSDLYTVGNLSYFIRIVNRISSSLGVVILLLSVIALVVGGVGILNIMLISVRERTREIGVRVALGARRREILRLFLSEALVLSLAGGVLGILLGSLVPLLIEGLFGLALPVSKVSILVALGVSVGVGVTFGLYPARKAADLDPAVALRCE